MKYSILLCLTFAFLSFGCKKEEIPIEEQVKETPDELSELCAYQFKGKNIKTTDCETDFFVNRLSSSGTVSYDSSLNNYVISRHIKGTIDCVIITLFCEEQESLKALEGKEINYSADYYEYTGSFKAPLGGMDIFVAKNIEYSLKK